MSRPITWKQYDRLRGLGTGAAGLSWRKRDTEPLLRRGWITADWQPPFYQWVRITPDGLRALAQGVERYGLPDLHPQAATMIRVCADCGSDRYRHEPRTPAQLGVRPPQRDEAA
jgi:hypothetical protein